MSKRSFEESLSRGGSQPPEHIDNAQNRSFPINDLLSPSQEQYSSSQGKKPRNFIATVVGVRVEFAFPARVEGRPREEI